jgi:hypothetical protein
MRWCAATDNGESILCPSRLKGCEESFAAMGRCHLHQSRGLRREGRASFSHGRIYPTALKNIIYLGPSDPDARESYGLLAVREGSVEDSAELRRSVDFNLGSEWFTRVWVFQEVVFSHNPWIQCGRAKVRWDRFCNILTTTLRTGAKGGIDQYGKSAHNSDNYQIHSQMQQARAKHQNLKGRNDLEKDGSSMPYSRKGGSDSNMLEL